jgi:hypothetical protein
MFASEPNKLSAAERLELGMEMAQKIERVQDSELRILIFTAAYFVLDGVTLTIRRLEGHLRARGATVKILTTVPDNLTSDELKDVIVVPGIKIPFNHAGDYSFGVGLDEHTTALIEAYKPNCVHFTVPDFVALDGIRWCQKNNVAYMGTWHSNYIDYLKYYFIEWVLGPGFHRYLKGFFEQLPTVYVPTTYVSYGYRYGGKVLAVSVLSLFCAVLSCSVLFHVLCGHASTECCRHALTQCDLTCSRH